jgi:hypothetical protein
VPTVDPNYAVGVDTWWAQHPLNPDNPNGIPIGGIRSPNPRINVKTQFNDNTQAAINALPDTGGTLYFPAGTYSPFQLVGRSNIHFISDGGAMIQGHSTIYGCKEAADYATFNIDVFHREPMALDCFTMPIHNFYFKNITFDGGNVANTALDVGATRDLVLDSVTFQNYARLDVSYEVGLLNVDRGSNNVWCRGCHFVGTQRMALFMDGVHGGGVVYSRFEKDFYAMWLMFGTNDDYTVDTDGTGVYDVTKQRTSQYIVVANNVFYGPSHEGMNVNGMQTLIKSNLERGSIETDFVRYSARCSQRGAETGLIYHDDGQFITGNRTDGMPTLVLMDQSSGRIDCPNTNYGTLGQYTIMSNDVLGAPRDFKLVEERGSIDGHNVVESNCVNNLSCPGSTRGSAPTVSPSALQQLRLWAATHPLS